MKRFKSVFLRTLLFLVIPFSFAYGAEPIYIGLMAPMTGDYAEYGMFFREGIQLAMDEINKAGGIKGQQVELVVGDSRADPKEAALVAQKFVANPKIVAVIGDFTSSCAMAAAPIYESAKMVEFSPSSSHPEFTKLGKFMFRNTPTQEHEGPFLARWLIKDLGKWLLLGPGGALVAVALGEVLLAFTCWAVVRGRRRQAAIGFFGSVEHPSEGRLKAMAVPSEWSASAPEYRRHAPRLGEHTREVLREAGYSEARIDALAASGAARL